MVKMKAFAAHKIEGIDAETLEKIEGLARQVSRVIEPIYQGVEPNYILASMEWVFAALIRCLVVDDPKEKERAAELFAANLYNDILRPLNFENSDEQN